MKKRVAIALIAIFLAIFLSSCAFAQFTTVSSQKTEADKFDSAYLWLISQVDGKWPSLDPENSALSLLALGSEDKQAADGKAALLSREIKDKKCFPSATTSSNCNALNTAFAILALNNLGAPVDDEAEWLISQEMPFKVSGINWFLQVDSQAATNCSVRYDSKEYTLAIKEDRKYSWPISTPSCLNLAEMNYWIRLSGSCLDKSYSITCEDPASVSLPYKLGTTLYVPAETFLTPADVAINTVCIREGANCNYEATLWGAYALMKAGKEYTPLLPYLVGEAEASRRAMPVDSILYLLTSKEEHAALALSQQSREGSWSDIGGKGKYWDTAMASLGLADYSPDNVTKARSWILKSQNTDGSFGTTHKIRDTALVLYALSPRAMAAGMNDCQDVYGLLCKTVCADDENQVSYSCTAGVCCQSKGAITGCSKVEDCSKSECAGQIVTDVFGRRGQCQLKETICDDNFDNDNNGLTDMDDPSCSVTCIDLGGIDCSPNEECDVPLKRALGTDRCCVGTCTPAEATCSQKAGVLCSSNQQCSGNIIAASDATTDRVCCDGSCKKKFSVWPWIILALIILLGIAGYISYKKGYLDRYIEKLKNYFKKPVKPATPYRPPVRPYSSQQQAAPPGPFGMQRPAARPAAATAATSRKSETRTESELRETIEKLKRYAQK